MKSLMVLLTVLLVINLQAAVEKPKFKIFWDLSKGVDNDPLQLYRHGHMSDAAEDEYGDFTYDMTSFLRKKFPRTVELSEELKSKWLVAANQDNLETYNKLGTFPDVLIELKGENIKGEAYIKLSKNGISKEDLSKFDLVIVTTATSYITPYTSDEAKAIRKYVENGGKFMLFGENFWTPRKNVKVLFNTFGFDLTMGLTQRWVNFLEDYQGHTYTRSDGGSWLCQGKAVGWHLDYEEYKKISKLGNEYKLRLKLFQKTYAKMGKDKLCKKRKYNGNENFKIAVEADHSFPEPYLAPVHYYGNVGKGKVWLFADGSFVVNHILYKINNNQVFLERLLDNIVKN